eukprot:923595-Ditylum_brightwellii.AAC.1
MAFFKDNDKMAIPQNTVIHLVNEGISTVDDLEEFQKADIKQIAANLRRPIVPRAPMLILGAKSVKRITAACKLVQYYTTINRMITPGNIQWETVVKNFKIQWRALKDKKDESEPDTPKIAKGLNIMKWSKSFYDFLNRCIGIQMILLAYVVQQESVVDPSVVPAVAVGQSYSAEHESVEDELIARATHNQPHKQQKVRFNTINSL